MKEKEAFERYGARLLATEKYIVRGKATLDGNITLYVHKRDINGNEQLPLGYILGSNMLDTFN